MQDDLRAELIKQFPSEVIETKDMTGKLKEKQKEKLKEKQKD